jgi:hypothetical protein
MWLIKSKAFEAVNLPIKHNPKILKVYRKENLNLQRYKIAGEWNASNTQSKLRAESALQHTKALQILPMGAKETLSSLFQSLSRNS